jgi:hypothetical protein
VSEFEVVLTSASIVVALAIARLLEGLRDTFDRKRRYWIHCLWVTNRLLLVFGSLLMSFEARGRVDPDAFLLLMVVIPPAIIFLQANALVTPQPGEVDDWRDHFWSVKKWFFGANMLYVLGVFLLSTYGLAAELEVVQRYTAPAIGMTLSIVGYRSSSERVHGVLAVVGILNVVAGTGRILLLS